MHTCFVNILAALSAQSAINIRIAAMFTILTGGLITGYIAATKFHLSEIWAKRIMTFLLVSFNWVIALLAIWRMTLTRQVIWVPVVGVVLMLAVTGSSAIIFSFFNLQRKSLLTLILAAGLSNLGYTGGAFLCYVFFGVPGLALANIYLVLWSPVVYFVFFPLLKINELQQTDTKFRFRQILDFRFIIFPALVTAIILNLRGVGFPDFINRLHIIDILVYVASTLAFFAIGLQVKLSRLKHYTRLYFPLSAVKFILTPAVALLLLWILTMTGQNLTPLMKRVIMILSVTPSAVVVVTMSNVFDLDGPLASALWVVTTAVFIIIVIPILFFVFA